MHFTTASKSVEIWKQYIFGFSNERKRYLNFATIEMQNLTALYKNTTMTDVVDS